MKKIALVMSAFALLAFSGIARAEDGAAADKAPKATKKTTKSTKTETNADGTASKTTETKTDTKTAK